MNFDSGLSAIDRQMLIPQFQENYFEQVGARMTEESRQFLYQSAHYDY